ncbi:hypothetical protein C8Q76DRAFT_796469 [Earliella scabrosa]|nr:hypothetical protein C8Q76DRAFT_796469 [Earliella scabrosa]
MSVILKLTALAVALPAYMKLCDALGFDPLCPGPYPRSDGMMPGSMRPSEAESGIDPLAACVAAWKAKATSQSIGPVVQDNEMVWMIIPKPGTAHEWYYEYRRSRTTHSALESTTACGGTIPPGLDDPARPSFVISVPGSRYETYCEYRPSTVSTSGTPAPAPISTAVAGIPPSHTASASSSALAPAALVLGDTRSSVTSSSGAVWSMASASNKDVSMPRSVIAGFTRSCNSAMSREGDVFRPGSKVYRRIHGRAPGASYENGLTVMPTAFYRSVGHMNIYLPPQARMSEAPLIGDIYQHVILSNPPRYLLWLRVVGDDGRPEWIRVAVGYKRLSDGCRLALTRVLKEPSWVSEQYYTRMIRRPT